MICPVLYSAGDHLHPYATTGHAYSTPESVQPVPATASPATLCVVIVIRFSEPAIKPGLLAVAGQD